MKKWLRIHAGIEAYPAAPYVVSPLCSDKTCRQAHIGSLQKISSLFPFIFIDMLEGKNHTWIKIVGQSARSTSKVKPPSDARLKRYRPMGMTYKITEMQDILIVSIMGDPGVADIKHILDDIRNASGYTHSARLWNFQESSFTFSQNEVLDIASYASTADKRPAKVAMLVKEDLSYGVSRIYEVFRHNDLTQINVFKDKSEAVAWLRESNQDIPDP